PSHNLQQTDATSGQGVPGQGVPGQGVPGQGVPGTDASGNGLGPAAGQGPETPGSWGDTGQTAHATGVAAVTGPGAHP
ncbi:hypothetical protein G3I50_25495, partial [Streptomyces parvus]|nr:hypothetical protein [Streptomyces parvus]